VAEQLVVGAGLSGLTAAILLSRRGYKVRMLERYKTVAGQPERWPSIDVTPMDTGALSRYLDIEIGEPQVKPCGRLDGYFWGEAFDVPVSGSGLVCVERGPRKTGLDGYLRDIAESQGVIIEYESPVLGQGRLSELPGGTIIATGLYAESYDALGIPYQMGRCFGGKGHTDRDGEAAIYFNDYTTDYAYWAGINGVGWTFLFKRGPIGRDDLAAFSEKLLRTEGIEVKEWLEGYGPTPTVKFSNPRLFVGEKIIAGTLSGMMEPFALFGVHGALVSGKIAAMAVEDRGAAYAEFRRCLRGWRQGLFNRKMYEHVPVPVRRFGVVNSNKMLCSAGPERGAELLAKGFAAVPGYNRVKEWERQIVKRPA